MNNNKCKLYKAKGFTLIEVIIAVSIVVILSSLTVPKITGYIDKAKNAKILNTGKQIYTAVMWSYSDQGNTFNLTKLLETVSSTSGITGINSSAISIVSTLVTIPFSSDSANCSVIIEATDSSFKVMKGTTKIFETNPSAN